MEEFVRKLALWHTKTFKPITTHEELEPIMATLGFAALPLAGAWREYVFVGGGFGRNITPPEPLPRPRLPFPRIDGLHLYTFRAFFDAVGFFLGKRDIADHFHVSFSFLVLGFARAMRPLLFRMIPLRPFRRCCGHAKFPAFYKLVGTRSEMPLRSHLNCRNANFGGNPFQFPYRPPAFLSLALFPFDFWGMGRRKEEIGRINGSRFDLFRRHSTAAVIAARKS
ncbi:hypothetical protein ACLOJK_021248 [Asimina triloba]